MRPPSKGSEVIVSANLKFDWTGRPLLLGIVSGLSVDAADFFIPRGYFTHVSGGLGDRILMRNWRSMEPICKWAELPFTKTEGYAVEARGEKL